MFALIGWLIIGLVAGGLARLMIPGRQPMGLLLTIILGLVGSLVGGFISSLLFGYDPDAPGLHASGLLMSTIGAILVLGLYIKSSQSRISS